MILVTGATGYLGSHMVVRLLKDGHAVYGIDNFYNSDESMLGKIHKIVDARKFIFSNIDLADIESVDRWLSHNSLLKIDTIVHFAGLKSVPDSVANPLEYYRNNLNSTINVCRIARQLSVKNIIFSSSSTVYSDVSQVPFDEYLSSIGGSSPYGWTKVMSEQIIKDYCDSTGTSCLHLRYFNPVGSHESGLLGDTNDNGLMVNILRAANEESILPVFGDDYDTRDGTCIRDYIHVDDLIDAHMASIDFIKKYRGVEVFNVGTGEGYTVLEILDTFSKTTGKKVIYEMKGRRSGDPSILIADNLRATTYLNWSPKKTLEDMCKSAQNYYEKGVKHGSNNPSA